VSALTIASTTNGQSVVGDDADRAAVQASVLTHRATPPTPMSNGDLGVQIRR
jgi:hypothetical protein